MAKAVTPTNRLICEYCGLESAVSHASTRECISGLQREATRLRDNMLHGRSGDETVWSRERDRSAAIGSLSLVGSSR